MNSAQCSFEVKLLDCKEFRREIQKQMAIRTLTIGVGLFLMAGGSYLTAAQKGKTGDPAKGKTTFEDNCAVCHNVATDEKKMGPSLKGLFKRATLKNGKKVTDPNVLGVINAGGNGMPSYAEMLNDGEKADVIAYLKTL